MSKLCGTQTLKEIYELGKTFNLVTMDGFSIGGSEYVPVEVTIESQAGTSRAFWTCDVDDVLSDAIENGDTAESNPNFPVLKTILKEMVEHRELLGHPPHRSKRQAIPDPIANILGLNLNAI